MFWIPPRKRDQYDPVFANNTWAQIIDACHKNQVPETWTVGSQKAMTIDVVDYLIDIIGKGHDDYASGGKAPLTFQLHDCYGELKNINSTLTNKGGWTSCAMRTTHLPDILAKMPAEVRNGIREVNKLTSAGSGSATIDTTADKLFLLSEIEIFGEVMNSAAREGVQYAYYKVGNSKMKNVPGSVSYWWERSPARNNIYFCIVDDEGDSVNLNPSYPFGVSFGFCF